MKILMMGNEAIGRAAIEAGVSVVAAYPGTPSSEIPEYVAKHAVEHDVYIEYSTNEKVALEVAVGASWSGLRTLVTMKHVGVNVAADPLMALTYTGVDGGFVLVSADDPSCHSSQNEQDNRYFALLANMPALEPSSPQEAHAMTKAAFDISEEAGLPVMLRPTTRACHCRADVETGDIREKNDGPVFRDDIAHHVTIPAHARVMHSELLDKVEKVRSLFEASPFNWSEGHGMIGIIASGISYAYVKEAVAQTGIKASVFKLGTVHPLPTESIVSFISDKEQVLVVEEMEPVVETQVKALAYERGLSAKILGKNVVPRMGELSTSIVVDVLSGLLNVGKTYADNPEMPFELPPRPPVLCPGCPHRATFYCINKASKKAIKTSDIGCYTLGVVPPLSAVDTTMCMGASIGVACGLSAAGNKEIVATIGDSTFFHTGLPALVNAVYNRHDITVVILDNRTTAMTGHQPNPGTGKSAVGTQAPIIDIAKVCEALGAYTQEVDPFALEDTIEAMKRANEHEGVSVIVAKRPCALIVDRSEWHLEDYKVDTEKCRGCKLCIRSLGCPALLYDEENKKTSIDDMLCVNCGVCAQVCPFDSIVSETNV